MIIYLLFSTKYQQYLTEDYLTNDILEAEKFYSVSECNKFKKHKEELNKFNDDKDVYVVHEYEILFKGVVK